MRWESRRAGDSENESLAGGSEQHSGDSPGRRLADAMIRSALGRMSYPWHRERPPRLGSDHSGSRRRGRGATRGS
eukprot:55836-Hanusia_phi.AAC.1